MAITEFLNAATVDAAWKNQPELEAEELCMPVPIVAGVNSVMGCQFRWM